MRRCALGNKAFPMLCEACTPNSVLIVLNLKPKWVPANWKNMRRCALGNKAFTMLCEACTLSSVLIVLNLKQKWVSANWKHMRRCALGNKAFPMLCKACISKALVWLFLISTYGALCAWFFMGCTVRGNSVLNRKRTTKRYWNGIGSKDMESFGIKIHLYFS